MTFSRARLGDHVTYLQRGKSPSYAESGRVSVLNQKCIRWQGVELKHARALSDDVAAKLPSVRFLRPGDVLINSTGEGTLGRASVWSDQHPDQWVADSHITIARPAESLDSEWLFFWLRSADGQELIGSSKTGATTQTELALAKLLEFSIPLPTFVEQRRIVCRIKECLERVEEIELDAAQGALEVDALFPAILNERFADIRSSYPCHSLEEVADIRGGGSLPRGSNVDHGNGSVLLIKVGDMNADGNERVVSIAREYLPREEAGRGLVKAGAVIFPKRGGAIATNKKRLLGRAALIDPNLMALVAKADVIHAAYLYYWCLTLNLAALSNGGVIPQLNRKDLTPLDIPLPSLDSQAQIVESLLRTEGYCEHLKRKFTESQGERDQLREAIFRKAFAGEL